MPKLFRQMANHDTAGGVLLVAAAFLAMLFANSALAPFYNEFLAIPVHIKISEFEIAKPLLLWVNDGLMALFFFLVGLEVKREILDGKLSSFDQVALPGVAAISGIVVPAFFYYLLNMDDPVAVHGWAIPSATDIAFALGVFALFGRHLPVSLKLFLLTVAIFDDIGAVIIIALFYSGELATTSLFIASLGLCVLFLLNIFSVRYISAFILVGVVVWAAVLKSGVHATLAGFALAWFIPLKVNNENGHPMLPSAEHALQPWVAFFILPLFAFANAGVDVRGASWDAFADPITLGIVAGLFLGKQLGIFTSCWLAVKSGLAKLPKNSTWLQLYAVSILCGIGFTMSLFIGSLAFENKGAEYIVSVKLGVLAGSLLSALIGGFLLTRCSPEDAKKKQFKLATS